MATRWLCFKPPPPAFSFLVLLVSIPSSTQIEYLTAAREPPIQPSISRHPVHACTLASFTSAWIGVCGRWIDNRCDVDALLCQCWRQWRFSIVLWPIRHRSPSALFFSRTSFQTSATFLQYHSSSIILPTISFFHPLSTTFDRHPHESPTHHFHSSPLVCLTHRQDGDSADPIAYQL